MTLLRRERPFNTVRIAAMLRVGPTGNYADKEMPRIAISYRRDDSLDITGRIFDRLAAHFGREAVFRDIDNIPPGADFRRHIDIVLDQSDIILAIVGPRWIGADEEHSRLASPADPVRLEIESALRQNKPLVPVLVLRAVMPSPDELPESLHHFAYRNAVQVDSGQDFDVHLGRLIRAIERILEVGQASAAKEAAQAVVAAIEAAPPIRSGSNVPDSQSSPVSEKSPAPPEAEPSVTSAETAVSSESWGKTLRLIFAALALLVLALIAASSWWVFVEQPAETRREVASAEKARAEQARLEAAERARKEDEARETEARARQQQEEAVRAARLEAETEARQQQAAAVEKAKREAEEEARREQAAVAAAALKRETEAKARAAAPPRPLYGALAVDEATAKWGFSWGQKTPRAAEASAINSCESVTCKIVLRVAEKKCVAVARGEGGTAWGAATRTDRAEAEDAAIVSCQKHTQHECAVRASECYR